MSRDHREKSKGNRAKGCGKEDKITNVIYIENDDSDSCKKVARRHSQKSDSSSSSSDSSSSCSSSESNRCNQKRGKRFSKRNTYCDEKRGNNRQSMRTYTESSSSSSDSDECQRKPRRHNRRGGKRMNRCSDSSSSDSDECQRKPRRNYRGKKNNMKGCYSNSVVYSESETLMPRPDIPVCKKKCGKKQEKKCAPWMGSDCFISVYDDTLQAISVGEAIQFNYFHNAYNIEFNPKVDPSKIMVKKTGVFYIHLQMDVDIPCQFTLFINGVPNTSTVDGTNTGGVQFATTGLLYLKRNDVLQWINYTSAQGIVTRTLNAGGLIPSINSQFTLFKIANEVPVVNHERTIDVAKTISRVPIPRIGATGIVAPVTTTTLVAPIA